MADHSRRDTDEFPVVADPADPLDPMRSHPVPGAAITVAPTRQRNRAGGILFGLLIGVFLIIIGVAVYFLVSFGRGADEPDTAAPATATVTTASTVEITEEATPEPPAGRSAAPDLPTGYLPVNEAARNGTPAGDLNNVYTGTGTTSGDFALNVRDEFVRNYLETGELNAVVQATSPATGQTYDLSCSDNGDYITCTGGNNAVIYIA